MKTAHLGPLCLTALAITTACTIPDLEELTDGPSATDGDTPAGSTTDAETDDGETGETGDIDPDGSSTTNVTGSDTDPTDTTTGDGEFACGNGRLFVGNPIGDVDFRPADGDPAIDSTEDGPSLPSRKVLTSPADPSKVVVTMGSELWYVDTTDDTVHHILGDFDGGTYQDGACDVAGIGIVADFTFRPDGTIYLAEHSGNGIAQVTDPFGPDCEMTYYAGTQESVNIGPLPHEPDLVDGAAADARFAGPDWITADGDDLYIVDAGNRAIRKIDAAHQVTTVAVVPSDYNSPSGGVSANGIAVVGGQVYLPVRGSVESSQNATILHVDPASGESTEIATGRDDPWLVGSSGPDMASLVAVGEGRVATWVNGRIFTVDVGSGEVEHIAGDGDSPWQMADFGPDYDPFGEHDAMALELDNHSSSTGASAYLSYSAGSLYFAGRADGYLVYEIDCE